MPNGSDVDQREYGELRADVRHISEAVGSLSSDVATMHGRMDEMFKHLATRTEHEKLAKDVDTLWDHQRKTDTSVHDLRVSMGGQKVGMTWMRDVLWLVVTVVAAAGGYSMGGF